MNIRRLRLLLEIFSFSASINALGMRLTSEPSNPAIQLSQSPDAHISSDVHSHSYAKDQSTNKGSLLAPPVHRLSGREKVIWTAEEDYLLKDLREKGWTWKEIGNALPRRTAGAAAVRKHNLKQQPDAPVRKQLPWTLAQDKVLHVLRAHGESWESILELFPDKTETALKTRYDEITNELPQPNNSQWLWTPEEESRLLKLKESGLDWREIAKEMPGRSPGAVYKHYTKNEDDERLRQLIKEDGFIIEALNEGKTHEEISQALRKPVSTIQRQVARLRQLGLVKKL